MACALEACGLPVTMTVVDAVADHYWATVTRYATVFPDATTLSRFLRRAGVAVHLATGSDGFLTFTGEQRPTLHKTGTDPENVVRTLVLRLPTNVTTVMYPCKRDALDVIIDPAPRCGEGRGRGHDAQDTATHCHHASGCLTRSGVKHLDIMVDSIEAGDRPGRHVPAGIAARREDDTHGGLLYPLHRDLMQAAVVTGSSSLRAALMPYPCRTLSSSRALHRVSGGQTRR